MDRRFIERHWYADIYEQCENHTNDVDFFLTVLRDQVDGEPQNILEVGCGGGRISIPLAQAGHRVTGFDVDEHMLLRCYRRTRGIPNMTCYQGDAINSDWGRGFDVVVMAGNILINIETDIVYSEAQRTLIRKAALALRSGGHLLMDFDLHSDSSAVEFFNRSGESSYFSGTDDLGTSGRTVSWGGSYDPVTRVWVGTGHWEGTTNSGERLLLSREPRCKHIPTQDQVKAWLREAGLTIVRTYRNYSDEPLHEQENDCVKATMWACKG